MKTVIVSGWRMGFQKVGFTELLRNSLGYSLSAAKEATDSVLDNAGLELRIPEADYDRLVPRLRVLGATIIIEEREATQTKASSELELSKP